MKIKPKELKRWKNWKVVSFMCCETDNFKEDCEIIFSDNNDPTVGVIYTQPNGVRLFWVLHPKFGNCNNMTMDQMWRKLSNN